MTIRTISVYLSRLRIFTLLLLICTLSACTIGNLTVSAPAKGPIQLYDVHGTLICQLHGLDPQQDCLAPNSAPRKVAFQFIDYALNELASDLHVKVANLPSSALNVSTTLDLNLQKQVLQKARQYIATMVTTHNMHNAAVVMLDYHTGALRALLGSLDSPTTTPAINVATQDPRQLASIFKPFVYASAFEQGISPGEVLYDGPFSVGTPPYSPHNFDQRFHGYMSYRTALQNNYNIPVLKTFVKTGFAALRKNVLAMGLTPQEIGPQEMGPEGYSLALGPRGATLLDTTVAYGTMADEGMHVPPHAIEKISMSSGQIVYTTKPRGTQALSPQTAFMLTDVMGDAYARIPEFGTCSSLELYATTQAQCLAGNPGSVRPAAVHSGAVETFRNTFTIGYTPDLVVGSWAGNSDDSPMFNITGLDGAAHIWHDSMLLAEAGKPIQQFPAPPTGVVKKTVAYPHLTTTDWYRV
jgi:membrane peptidoglycan carboxypeptidase